MLETDKIKVLWNFNTQCDHIIEARIPDIVVVGKEDRFCKIIDVTVPADCRVNSKESEKNNNNNNIRSIKNSSLSYFLNCAPKITCLCSNKAHQYGTVTINLLYRSNRYSSAHNIRDEKQPMNTLLSIN